MKKYLPILSWIKDYNKSMLLGDISAGITVGIMLIPQGMAYAMLAGLPPIYGLYASTIPLLIYAILGTSRQLAVGPVAMVSLLVASGVGAIAELGSEHFISLAILLALMVGVIQFLLGIFKLGFLVNFLSHPVVAGFTSAAALIIGFSQLKHLLGIDIPRGKIHETLIEVVKNIESINLATLAIGFTAIVLILLLRKMNRRIPSPLIVVVLGLAVVVFFDLESYGVQIIKEIPSGFPSFSFPKGSIESVKALFPIALAISFISYMESYAVAKAVQSKHKDYSINPNQELIGLGASNIVGSFFSAFPITGGFSRTAVNDQAGAKSGFAAIVSATLVMVTLLFLTSYFYYLPKAVLASIIMVAVFGLIEVKEAKHLWKKDKYDFLSFISTFIATITLGIEPGILIGVAISLLVIMYKLSYPHVAELGQIDGTSVFRNVERFTNLNCDSCVLILRFDAPLFFANANAFKDVIVKKLASRDNVEKIIIDGSGLHHIDSSALHMLNDLVKELFEKEILIQFVDIKGPARDIMYKNGLINLIGKENFFLNLQTAMTSNANDSESKFDKYILQSD